MDYLIVSRLIFGLNLVTVCHNLSRSVCYIQFFMFNTQLLCLNSIVSLIDSTQLGQVLLLYPFFLGDLSKFSLISHSLFLLMFLYSDVLLFTSTWKMVKDTPDHIPMNIIG